MSEPVQVFIDGRVASIAAGSSSLSAVAGLDPALAERVRRGEAYLTDGRGIRLEPDAPVFAGAILRVVISARPGPSVEISARTPASRPSARPPVRPPDDAHA